MLDSSVIQALQNQLNKERQNSQIYGYIALCCENQAYDGFGKFFHKQSLQELEHHQLFADFLMSKGIQPNYTILNSIPVSGSLKEFAQYAYDTERSTTDALEEIYRTAQEAEEFQVCAFLVGLLTEQIEEETFTKDLLDQLSRTDENGWVVLDEQYGDK